ncbi:MAG: hypothetical protein WDM91_16190 [Rhizomicrobium sp.]
MPRKKSTSHISTENAGVQFVASPVTVGDLIVRCFPEGTQIEVLTDESGLRIEKVVGPAGPSWKEAPRFPPDLFAICGLLLNLSGAVHHTGSPNKLAGAHPAHRSIVLSEETRSVLPKVAADWRNMKVGGRDEFPPFIAEKWRELLSAWPQPVFKVFKPGEKTPDWWTITLELFVIADEAALSLGFQGSENSRSKLWAFYQAYLASNEKESVEEERAEEEAENDDQHVTESDTDPATGRYTLSTISPDIACVLPKSRTAQVGCTLRSLSHHLALVPPRGLARAYWIAPPAEIFKLRDDTEPLNLLLVPWPYDLPASSFKPETSFNDDPNHRWGWFGVRQNWGPDLPENPRKLAKHIELLAEVGAKKAGPIHGIVLPEMAITYDTFKAIRKLIEEATDPNDAFYDIELLVAGVRTNSLGKAGNYAAACIFSRPTRKKDSLDLTRLSILHLQPKHHRWRIDARQVATYGIGSSLTAGVTWWENVPLLSRRISTFVFRRGSTFIPLICEDLARLEPVHDLVRSIGPTIVFALLMDGPQVPARWPGRYAMGLADDPGCSVLTLSSLGIVNRAVDRPPPGVEPRRSIGLWRDETGDTREIVVAPGTCAVVLSLSGQRVNEFTVDGRSDGFTARRWVYSDHIAIDHACEFQPK